MSDAFDDVLAANADYAGSFRDPGLPGRASRELAVVTCMDSRIDVLPALGLVPGDAKILRTAGARVSDEVLRSLVFAHHLLGVRRVLVLAHTDCAMAKATDEQVHARLRDEAGLDTRSLVFGASPQQEATLAQDVQRVRSSPFLPGDLAVAGGVFDVHTGKVTITVP